MLHQPDDLNLVPGIHMRADCGVVHLCAQHPLLRWEEETEELAQAHGPVSLACDVQNQGETLSQEDRWQEPSLETCPVISTCAHPHFKRQVKTLGLSQTGQS